MAVNPLKVFLFLAGGCVAAGATAFVSGALDPYLYENASTVGSSQQPAQTNPAAPKDQRLLGSNTPAGDANSEPSANTMAAIPPGGDTANPSGTMTAKPPAAEAVPPAGPQPPTFDVVRVEADGSVVVAGKALPDSTVDLLNGEMVLGSAKATPEGDFAIALDEPLKPGAYQITLRSTPPGGAAVASLETAVLSIPDKPGGQVLAMVEEPGKASQLLSMPQPEASAQPNNSEASPPPSADANPAGAPSPAQPPKTDEAAGPPASAGKPAATAAAPAQTTPAAQTTPTGSKVAVEAVEIEGSKIFVAGIGEPGRFVRVYANEILLGQVKIGAGGRFLVEAKRDLPVGQYTIRADMLDGATVIARAAVPFEREPGEKLAAVAPGVRKTGQAPAGGAAAPSGQPAVPAEGSQPTTAAPANNTGSQGGQPAVAANEMPPAGSSASGANPSARTPADAAPAAGPSSKGADVAIAPETVSPSLQKVQGAVIIRRGDTLWRISRRVYGHGTRYSTIYLANQKQIRDPDRIWPGQIFTVPDKSKEGEAADMSDIVDQMVKTLPAE
jgi:nucleoid-associated protein YgaU